MVVPSLAYFFLQRPVDYGRHKVGYGSLNIDFQDEESILNDPAPVTITDSLKWNPDRYGSLTIPRFRPGYRLLRAGIYQITGAVIYRIQPTSKFLFASRVAATLNTPVPLFFGKHPRFFRVSC